MAVGILNKDIGLSVLGRLGITGEEKEALYRFLRNEIGREGIRALAVIWFDEGKTEAQIASLLFISARNVRRWIRRYRENGILGLHEPSWRVNSKERTLLNIFIEHMIKQT